MSLEALEYPFDCIKKNNNKPLGITILITLGARKRTDFEINRFDFPPLPK